MRLIGIPQALDLLAGQCPLVEPVAVRRLPHDAWAEEVARASGRDAHVAAPVCVGALLGEARPELPLAAARSHGRALANGAVDAPVHVEVVERDEPRARRRRAVHRPARERQEERRPLIVRGAQAVVDDRRAARRRLGEREVRYVARHPLEPRPRRARRAATDDAHAIAACQKLAGDERSNLTTPEDDVQLALAHARNVRLARMHRNPHDRNPWLHRCKPTRGCGGTTSGCFSLSTESETSARPARAWGSMRRR
jgi:hypothetical protein